MRAILLGVAASLFFAVTFVLNRAMHVAGGDWIWSASLRFFWMVPLLALLVAARGRMGPVLRDMARRPGPWLLWSTVGFGLFYAPLCYAAASGPAWLVAGTWQLTIVAGVALGPLLRRPGEARTGVPMAALGWSGVILAGVALMQWHEASSLTAPDLWTGVGPMLVAAFAYPLGNRQMMRLCGDGLDAVQRAFGMTVASLPFWLVLSGHAALQGRLPTQGQLGQTLLVAIGSGVIATVLFFAATNAVKHAPARLAAVEATQAGELVFAALGEVLFLGKPWPSGWSLSGLGLIVAGMVCHARSTLSRRRVATPAASG